MPLTQLNHVTVRTQDMEGTKDFYEKVLGLKAGWRPPLAFPGYWLYCGEQPVVHLVPDSGAIGAGANGEHTGNFDHVAFLGQDFGKMRRHFMSLGIRFEDRDPPGAGVQQIFFPDPNGVMIEINFPKPA
ncbi:MAG TPA: VOC family protein [Stellaceae bacterium]|nr:VOC family protein [Stellaceae bacterium]